MTERKYGEYEILAKRKHALVEYDASSNKPFMVYEHDNDLNWTSYSGEETLEEALNVMKERNKLLTQRLKRVV